MSNVKPSSAMVPNTARQPSSACTQPPMMGAAAGPRPKIIVIMLMSRCASAPWKLSRTMARPMICPPPATSPCTARNASSVAKFGAAAQPIDASV